MGVVFFFLKRRKSISFWVGVYIGHRWRHAHTSCTIIIIIITHPKNGIYRNTQYTYDTCVYRRRLHPYMRQDIFRIFIYEVLCVSVCVCLSNGRCTTLSSNLASLFCFCSLLLHMKLLSSPFHFRYSLFSSTFFNKIYLKMKCYIE